MQVASTAIEWADMVQEYVTVLVWPGLVLFALWLFRLNLAGLIDRIKSFTAPGGIGFESPLSQPTELVDENDPLGDGQQPPLTADELALAKQQLYEANRALFFERVYRIIWGTQIMALKRANESRGVGIDRDTIEVYHQESQRRMGQPLAEAWEFDRWVSFLVTQQLLWRDANGNYQLTTNGLDFLNYITTQGLSEFKAF